MSYLWVVALFGCSESSSAKSGAAEGDGNNYYDEYSDVDSDGDGDGDRADDEASGGLGTDSDTPIPPEREKRANYKVPQGAGKYVFIPDEVQDSVAIVDSETFAVKVVEVGSRPTHLVTLNEPGEVLTPLLPEGPYLVWGFADANRNGRLDVGSIRPWEAAERVDAIPDTQYVRDTFEGIVATPLELGGIRHTLPIPAAVDTGRTYHIPPHLPPTA